MTLIVLNLIPYKYLELKSNSRNIYKMMNAYNALFFNSNMTCRHACRLLPVDGVGHGDQFLNVTILKAQNLN